MLDQHNVIHATGSDCVSEIDSSFILSKLAESGYCLLRGYNAELPTFSALVNALCSEVTYDPARVVSAESVQKVDAGIDAIGLHIENGNTPKVPHLLGFYCRQAASCGSQTTLCDGQVLWNEMPDRLRSLFTGNMTVTRTLSEMQWKSYLAQEHPLLNSADQVTLEHLQEMQGQYSNHSARLSPDGSLEYSLITSPVKISPLSQLPAFANTILGPSFNYAPPGFTLSCGSEVTAELQETLREYCEAYTLEINWQDGDVVLLDNWRVMHGRRAIVDAGNRELFIGMGMVQ